MTKAACLLILNENTLDIRVVNRRNSNLIGLPGGKVEEGEDTLAAAVRETAEETGFVFDPAACTLLYEGVDGNFTVTTYFTTNNDESVTHGSEEGISSHMVDWQDFVYKSAFQDYNKKVVAKLHKLLLSA